MFCIIVLIISSSMFLAMLTLFLLSIPCSLVASTTFVIAKIPDHLIAKIQGMLSKPNTKAIIPICHGPLGPDRFMGGGGVQSARTFKNIKSLSKSSFDHEILHLPPRCIWNKTINFIFYLFWGGGGLKISNCKKKMIQIVGGIT